MKLLKSKLNLLVIAILVTGFVGFSALASSPTSAVNDGATKACEGLSELGVECDSGSGTAQEVASGPIRTVVGLLSFAVGVACVLMIIYGAFRIVTSGGNSDSVKSGRTTIIYALVGLVLVLLANVIVSFTYQQAKDIESGGDSSSGTVVPQTNGTSGPGASGNGLDAFDD